MNAILPAWRAPEGTPPRRFDYLKTPPLVLKSLLRIQYITILLGSGATSHSCPFQQSPFLYNSGPELMKTGNSPFAYLDRTTISESILQREKN